MDWWSIAGGGVAMVTSTATAILSLAKKIGKRVDSLDKDIEKIRDRTQLLETRLYDLERKMRPITSSFRDSKVDFDLIDHIRNLVWNDCSRAATQAGQHESARVHEELVAFNTKIEDKLPIKVFQLRCDSDDKRWGELRQQVGILMGEINRLSGLMEK